ncbi:MAG: ABC transporter permease [Clostridia bacterium]|nr:ABC transporter permease [Clostridia bacterium]
MKNSILVIFKKELARFFGDKRLFFTTVLLPGLVIFIMYSIMGDTMSSTFGSEDKVFDVAAANIPLSLQSAFESEQYNIINYEIGDIEKIKSKIADKEYELCVVFPDSFDEALKNYKGGNAKENAPNVQIYYNSASIDSSHAYAQMRDVLSGAEEQVCNVFNVNYSPDNEENIYDMASEEESSGMLFAMVLPMILMTLMYSSCAALAPESIAGEKERGTIASLLITPIPRNHIVIGKVMALSVMALLSGLSSFLGTLLSMPKLVGTMGDEMSGISAAYYSPFDFFMLILVILSTVILFITAISIFSTIAKNVKEASTMVLPLMIVVMLISFSSMYSSQAKEELVWYLIPVYNSVESMVGIFLFSASPVSVLVTIAVNLIASTAGFFVLSKLFKNENVMFGK